MGSADYYMSLLAGEAGSPLESAESRVDLGAGRVANSIEALEQQLAVPASSQLNRDKAGNLLKAARTGLEKLAGDGQDAALTDDELLGLEAVILTDGSRPALFIQDHSIELQRSVLGEWHADAQIHTPRISVVNQSVGRIDNPAASQRFSGTGFVIDSGVIVTNRHVLEAIAEQQPDSAGAGTWTIRLNIEINFGHEFERATGSGYEINRVLYAGPTRINHEVHFDRLDMAVLECDTDSSFPPAIKLAESSSTVSIGNKVYVVGYPAKPRFEDSDVLTDIFANTFGHKRWAPGRIQAGPGTLNNDTKTWVVSHDASTLGGNSGSAVLLFEGSGDVCVGLHFSGLSRKENYAHVIAVLRDELAIR